MPIKWLGRNVSTKDGIAIFGINEWQGVDLDFAIMYGNSKINGYGVDLLLVTILYFIGYCMGNEFWMVRT